MIKEIFRFFFQKLIKVFKILKKYVFNKNVPCFSYNGRAIPKTRIRFSIIYYKLVLCIRLLFLRISHLHYTLTKRTQIVKRASVCWTMTVNICHEIFNKNVNRDIDGLTGRLTYRNIFSEISLGNRTNSI